MEEINYQREKLRRELQECINELDKATADEDGVGDHLAALRLIILADTVSKYVDLVREKVKDE